MTSWQPPVARKVRSLSSDSWIQCNWFECDRPGYELYKTVVHEHAKELFCEDPRSEHINHIFCSEKHKQLFIYSPKKMGYLPPGYRNL